MSGISRRFARTTPWIAAATFVLLGGVTRAKGDPASDGGGGSSAFDASAPPSGAFSAIVGIVVNGQLVCSGVLVEARLVLTAASCVNGLAASTASLCLAVADACMAAPAVQLDPTGQVAAFVLPADALAEPVTYGRGDTVPVVGDAVSAQGYDDPVSLVASVIATDATTDTLELDPGSGQTYDPTDLGSPLTFTPGGSAGGTLTTSVYGVLVSLGSANDGGGATEAVYARVDTIARSFLDPLVQGTRTAPNEGCR